MIPHKINQALNYNYTTNRITPIGSALSKMEQLHKGKIVYMVVTKKMLDETDTTTDDIGELVNYT